MSREIVLVKQLGALGSFREKPFSFEYVADKNLTDIVAQLLSIKFEVFVSY